MATITCACRPSLGSPSLGSRAPSPRTRSAPSRRGGRAEYIRLHQMVPAARATYLDDMHREFFVRLCHPNQFLGCARRPGRLAEPIAEHPRNQRQLLFPADRAGCLTAPAVELRGPEQIRIRVAHLRDTDPPRVHIGKQGPAPERIVHHLPLNSHDHQSSGVRKAAPTASFDPVSRTKLPIPGFVRMFSQVR